MVLKLLKIEYTNVQNDIPIKFKLNPKYILLLFKLRVASNLTEQNMNFSIKDIPSV